LEGILLLAWSQFLVCAIAIAIAGYQLARYGDVIAEKSKLGRTWVGVILVATVTSLPELVTGISSVTLADAPNIAVGNVLGACVLNLVLLAVLDFLYREMPIYQKASSGHILSAGFSIILLGLVVFSLITNDAATLHLGHIGIYTPLILLIYAVAMRTLYVQERRQFGEAEAVEIYTEYSMRVAVIRYLLASTVVVAAGLSMPFAALNVAEAMGWGQAFVGTLLVATATTLPEAASTIGALRIGAIDLAIGNLLGSNLFNITILAYDDIAYVNGPLLTHVSPTHSISGVSAIVMTGVAVVGLYYRPAARVFRIGGWVSLALFLSYILNSWVLYLRGH
jgi:cation:H+ antiporter